MLLVVSLQLLQELFGIIQELDTGSVHPVLLLLYRALHLTHYDLAASGTNYILEQHDTTT
jgi:hypothetical protein